MLLVILMVAGCAKAAQNDVAFSAGAYCSLDALGRTTLRVASITPRTDTPIEMLAVPGQQLDSVLAAMSDAGLVDGGEIFHATFDPTIKAVDKISVRSWLLTGTGRETLPKIIKKGDSICPSPDRS